MQISLATRDVFIECTATDLTKARIVLNTVCTMFSEYCAVPFEVEPVEVVDAFGATHGEPTINSHTPLLACEQLFCAVDWFCDVWSCNSVTALYHRP